MSLWIDGLWNFYTLMAFTLLTFALSCRMIIFNNDREAGLSKREGFVYQNKGECTKQDMTPLESYCLHFTLDHTITLLIDLINFDMANRHGIFFGKLTKTPFAGL